VLRFLDRANLSAASKTPSRAEMDHLQSLS
jgi:hypothetical protein